MQVLYTPESGKKMKVVVFFSGGASSMKYMLENDSNHGELYEVVAAFTDNLSAEKGVGIAKNHGIPDIVFDRKVFYRQGDLDPKIFDNRKFYYEMVCERVKEFKPDIIALSGYMHIISDPLLGEYENRIFNVHPADLSILKEKDQGEVLLPLKVLHIKDMDVKNALSLIKENMERAYKGEDAVADAVLNGEKYTKSTVHIATEDFDEGPILVQSKGFPVDRKFVSRKLEKREWGAVVDYAHDLQEKMKKEGDGPAYAKALELTSLGKLSLDRFTVLLDGLELPYYGFQLGE
jgi:folate-dependent phosphoribosylglycinamide formyltransferase PurN